MFFICRYIAKCISPALPGAGKDLLEACAITIKEQERDSQVQQVTPARKVGRALLDKVVPQVSSTFCLILFIYLLNILTNETHVYMQDKSDKLLVTSSAPAETKKDKKKEGGGKGGKAKAQIGRHDSLDDIPVITSAELFGDDIPTLTLKK